MPKNSTTSPTPPTTTPRRQRKTITLALAVVVVLLGAGAAFAYWTTGGSGTGSAATGTGTATVTVNQTSLVTNLRPGGPAQTLSGDFDNDGDSTAYVGTVTASISAVDKAVGAPAGVCTAADYTLTHPAMLVDADIPSGSAQGDWGTTAGEIATIEFNNTAANQDGCKGATVTLAYAVS